ncbi:MAG: ABC transporter permease [Bryobacteraceae bacterium]
MEWLAADIRYAFRALMRAPLFTATAILSLALGIGANSAIFSLVDQVILRPLPVKDPSELVVIKSPGPRTGSTNSDEAGSVSSFSYPLYKDLRDQNQALSGLLASWGFNASLAIQGQTERGQGELVSGNYFETLGVTPAIGRVFTPADDLKPGAHQVAVLSYSYWANHLGANPAVLNQSILVNGSPMTIVGVAQRGYAGVEISAPPDVFVPMMMREQIAIGAAGLALRNNHWLHILGRLRPGVSRAQAAASMQPLFSNILRLEADELKISGKRREQYLARKIMVLDGSGGRRILANDSGAPLIALMAMVGLVLLIACANVANLLMARAATRQKEIAVRLAIGASRWQLVRQLLVESLLLGLISGIVGVLAAAWTLDALLRFMQLSSQAAISASLDSRVLAFHFALSLGAGILFGLAPALQGTRPDLAPVLKDQSGAVGGASHARIRQILVASQMALTLLLVTGAALFGKSLLQLRSVDLGMRTSRIASFAIEPRLNDYTPVASMEFARTLQSEIAAIPGVQAVSYNTEPIFAGSDEGKNITAEGYLSSPDADDNVLVNRLGTGYFAALGIPLIAGREFSAADGTTAPKVCLINEKTAARFFKGRNPLGLHIAFGAGNKVVPDMEIVGIVKNSRHNSVRDTITPFVYVPLAQSDRVRALNFYVRSTSDPSAQLATLRETVRRLDANLPIFQTRTLDAQIDESLLSERLLAILTTALGGLAVLLATLGIYGLLAYVVARRTREIGLRMALGASSSEVRWLVLKDVGKLALAGAAVGLPASYALARFSESLLFGVSAADFTVAFLGIGVLLLVAFAGAYLPTRRATRIDTMTALRMD